MRVTSILFFIALSQFAFVQKEANVWYFGANAGLDFNYCVPNPLNNSNLLAYESSAVISDSKTGKLLFYTNGREIRNSKNLVMANGDSLKGASDITQGSLILPIPGKNRVC